MGDALFTARHKKAVGVDGSRSSSPQLPNPKVEINPNDNQPG